MLRSSGIKFDLRKLNKYELYNEIKFNTPLKLKSQSPEAQNKLLTILITLLLITFRGIGFTSANV